MSDQLNIDKREWELVALGDLATEIAIRVDNPSHSGIDKFVGLEHFVSGDLKIKSYKTTENLTSATKQFQSGDVLFARRNAYLRRASIVDFDGVCSGDAFVLREKHDRIVPGFLAFIVNSESLWNFANSNAAGTMSKRVKWRDLANFEFLLPPKAQQTEIAELLWAVDAVVEKQIETDQKIDLLIKSYAKAHYFQKHEKLIKLKDIGKWVSGGTPSRRVSEYWSGDIPWVSPKDMKREIIENSIEHISQGAVNDGAKLLPEKSILMVVRGLILAHSFPVGLTKGEIAFNQDIRAVIPSENIIPEYMLFFLHAIKDRVLCLTTTTTHGTRRLATDTFSEILMPCPSYKDQKDFTDKVLVQKAAKENNLVSLKSAKLFRNTIINQFF